MKKTLFIVLLGFLYLTSFGQYVTQRTKLVAGTNITLQSSANTYTINSSGASGTIYATTPLAANSGTVSIGSSTGSGAVVLQTTPTFSISVGIATGTATPTHTLDVNGNMVIGDVPTTITPFGQFELNKTYNGDVNGSIKNLSSGNKATTSAMVWNDLGHRLDYVITSSTYTSTSNGLTSDQQILVANGGTSGFVFGCETASNPLYIITGGNNLSNRRLTIDGNGIWTATIPLASGTSTGATFNTTSTGSTGTQTGLKNNLLPGYTGSGGTFALYNANTTAGTGTDPFVTGAVNAGLLNIAGGTTTGTNIGSYNQGYGGDISYGALSYGYDDIKANSTHIGCAGFALNTGSSGKQIAGYFGLQATTPTFASAALMCDNGATTSDIFVARDNGTAKFTIADGGNINATGSITASSFIGNASTATTAGSLTGSQDWTDYSSTSTITGWVSFTTKILEYKLIDAHTMIVHFKLSGTSNATSVSFTLPQTSNSSTGAANQMIYCTDNGTDDFGLVSLPANSATVTIYYHTGLANWTNSGQKTVSSDGLIVHY